MTNTPPVPTIADLWRHLRAWLAIALRRGPAAVARLVARKSQDTVARRLRLIESLLMKLLLIEAARPHNHRFPGRAGAVGPRLMTTCGAAQGAACEAASAASAVSMGPGMRAMRASGNRWRDGEDPARPATWRVRFRPRLHGLLPVPAACSRRLFPRTFAQRTSTPAPTQAKACALARRFESIRRVIAAPRRAIAALARRLQALGDAARALARAIALSRPPRCAKAPLLLAHATVYASDASAVFNNTS
jgi:hypothetical protein